MFFPETIIVNNEDGQCDQYFPTGDKRSCILIHLLFLHCDLFLDYLFQIRVSGVTYRMLAILDLANVTVFCIDRDV